MQSLQSKVRRAPPDFPPKAVHSFEDGLWYWGVGRAVWEGPVATPVLSGTKLRRIISNGILTLTQNSRVIA